MITIKDKRTVIISIYADAPSSRSFTLSQGGETLVEIDGADPATCFEAVAGEPISVSATGSGGPSAFTMNVVAPAPTLAAGTPAYPHTKIADFEIGGDPTDFIVCDSVGLLIAT